MWNAYDAGRPAASTGGRVGRTLWATVSRSARLDGLRQSRVDKRQATYSDFKAWARDRTAEIRARQSQEFKANYERLQVARTSTLRQYEQEQKEYRRRWAERNQANRAAWQAFRAKYHHLERERQRHMRQQDNLRRLEDRGQQAKRRSSRRRDAELDR